MLHMLALLLAAPFVSVWAAPVCTLVPSTTSSTAMPAQTASTSCSGNSTTTTPSSYAPGRLAADEIVAATWYAGWHSDYLPPEKVSWSKYTSVYYSFGVTTNDPSVISLEASDESVLPAFVEQAHQNGVRAILTIGGWTGSQYFSTAVGSAENRTIFVNTMMSLVSKYQLDGLDFDWEYPNKQGIGCNIINPQDTPNFLSFLQELRAAPGAENLTLSAAASIVPFAGTDGMPSGDVSEFAKVLDYLAIMNYDVWGSWSSSVGPNAPLDDSCAPAADQQGSATSAVKAWVAAGFPANQLVLGVAAYGHSFYVDETTAMAAPGASGASSAATNSSMQPAGTTVLAAYPAFEKTMQPLGDSWDVNATASVDQCGATVSGPSGIFNFWGLIEQGLLDETGTAKSGMGFRFDNCSQTPYVYNPQTQTMVSYDDTTSFAAKGKFINEQGLRGFAMWEAAGDYKDMLLDSISNAIGIQEGDSCSA